MFPVAAAVAVRQAQCSYDKENVPCCLDLGWWRTTPGAPFSLNNCHPHTKGTNQLFTATPALSPGNFSQLRIALDGFCLTQTAKGVSASPCKAPGSADQLWSFEAADGTLKSKAGVCLHAGAQPHDGSALGTAACSSTDPNQKFSAMAPKHQQPQQQAQEKKQRAPAAAVPPPTLVEAAILQRLVAVLGESAESPARHISFRGVRFAHAATTQLERYEVCVAAHLEL